MPSMTESLAGRALGPEWRVASHTSTELVLEHRGPSARRVGGVVVVSLGALSLGLLIGAACPPEARLIGWPVAGLLFLVAALGLPSALRNLVRARRGVRLRISDADVEGWPVKLSFTPLTVPTAEVERVAVSVFPHPPLSLALFEVILRDGTRLAGPEVAVPAGEAHPLGPVEAAARALLHR